MTFDINPKIALELFPSSVCKVGDVEMNDIFSCDYIYKDYVVYARPASEMIVEALWDKTWMEKYRVLVGGISFIENRITKECRFVAKVPESYNRHYLCKRIRHGDLDMHIKRLWAKIRIRVHIIELLKNESNLTHLRSVLYDPTHGIIAKRTAINWIQRLHSLNNIFSII